MNKIMSLVVSLLLAYGLMINFPAVSQTMESETVLTEAEITTLVSGKAIHWDCNEFGTCVQKFEMDGTFEHNNKSFFDWGKWFIKDGQLCRDYSKSRTKSCLNIVAKDGDKYFANGEKRTKILKITQK